MHGTVARAVNEMHLTLGLQCRLQHWQGRGNPHATADQHQRLVAGNQGEIASRWEQLQGIAHRQYVVQVVGDLAARLALDADAVFLAVAQCRQGIVTALLGTVDVQLQADVLARLGLEHRLAIHRGKVERYDFAAFLLTAYQAEFAGTAPATFGLFLLFIEILFGTDQDVGQLAIGRAPGIYHGGGGDFLAQHFFDGAQQAAADDRVVLGQNLQGNVLVDDLADQAAKLLQLVDVAGIHQHAVGQGARLVTTGLVGLVEQRTHLRVLAEHHLVEVGGQRFAAAFQQGDSGLDDCTLFGIEHCNNS
eukprot:Unigene11584_Nuclearia_a/m.35293 Unigene11584_Nuclearia_a/g.35293  ORF Unigene11584_Nuclearia_a/g.35293 Unigene11584_Nuclearia_a/m.35293 type:complete len:305 (+) Unigene11584_Nuclearia_a:299-1213(+)